MIKTVVQCSSKVEQLLKGGVSTSHAMCEESSENTHIFPNICDACKSSNNYVIADYINKMPGARFDLIRAWKEESRQPKSESSGGATNTNATSSTASVQPDNLSAPVGENESTDPSQSPLPSSASSKTSPAGAGDLTEIKTRLDRLKGRVEHLLTKLHAQKTSIENDAANSKNNKD